MKVQESDSHWKVMVFMDEYEMPSTSKDAMVTPSSHSRPRCIIGYIASGFSFFVARFSTIIRRDFTR